MVGDESSSFFIVGIGASAGGLEAISVLLAQLPSDNQYQVAYIIAQHLSPHYKSMLAQLLRRETPLKVVEAESGMLLKAGHIYITPPDNEIKVEKQIITLSKPSKSIGPKPSVDILFRSLAQENEQQAIGIILSGTGSDGADGIIAIKNAGGITIVQDPSTAKYDGMPMAAVRTGCVDLILSAEKIGQELEKVISDPNYLKNKSETQQQESKNQETALERVFELLSNRTGTNFSNYKLSTIHRRLDKRLSTLNINDVDQYLEYVEQNPAEIDLLFNTILIGVTSFFRDTEAFKSLKKSLQNIVENKEEGEAIRIWVTGCATGEEAYSIAILLSEILQGKSNSFKLQIFATDIDEEALSIARRGLYNEKALSNISGDILRRYFIKRENGSHELVKSLRSMVLFSKHDVTAHPPFLRLDLISCRNLLIYFGIELQRHVLPIFHYALNKQGYLFLGKSETIGQFSDLFATLDSKLKLFQKKETNNQHVVQFSSLRPKRYDLTNYRSNGNFSPSQSLSDKIRETLYNSFEFPYILVNQSFSILEIKGNVRDFLSFPEGNVNLNLIKLVHEDLQIVLRRLLSLAIRENSVQRSKLRRYKLFDKYYYLRLIIRPVVAIEENVFLIIFEHYDIEEELQQIIPNFSNESKNLRTSELERELTATKEHLQTYIEEIETANEELQSLNEELQSANEELQSSNEELETSNEELQSTNEEIQIAYGELKSANEALERKEELLLESNASVNALLNHTQQGFILVGKNYFIKSFNQIAQNFIYRLSQKQLNDHDLLIDFIPSEYISNFQLNFQKCLEGEQFGHRQLFPLSNGKDFWLYLEYTPVITEGETNAKSVALSLIDLSLEQQLKTSLSQTERLLDSVFDAVSVGVCVTDQNGRFVNVNKQYCKIYGYQKEELINQKFTMVVPPEGRIYAQALHDEFIKTGEEPPSEWQVQRKDGSMIDVFVYAILLKQQDGTCYKVTSVRDITESRKYRNLLLQTQKTAKVGGWEYDVITEQLSWTDEIYEMLEIQEDEHFQPTLQQMLNLHIGDYKNSLNQALDNAIYKGEAFDIELELSKQSLTWVRATCKPIRVGNRTIKLFGTFQDITQQKHNQQELLKLSLVASHVNNGVMLMNDKGIIEWVNHGLSRMLDYPEEYFKTKNINTLYQVNDNEKPITDLIKLQDFISLEAQFHRQNQESLWVQLDITAVRNEYQQIINYIAIVSDVSGQYFARLQLQENEENYRKLARNIPNTDIYLFDKDLRFIIVEGTSMPQHGLKPSDFENKRLEETLDSDTVAYLKPLYEQTLSGEKVYSEYFYQGHYYLHQSVPIRNKKGEIQSGLFLSTNITRLKQAEEGLRISQTNLSHSQQIAQLGSWRLDLSHQTLYLSTEHLKVMGIDSKEEIAMPVMEYAERYLHPEDVSFIQERLEWAISNNHPDYEDQFEYRIRPNKKDDYKYFKVKSFYRAKGEIFGVTQDITEQKHNTLQRELLIKNLKSFAFITSHNLRRPLANILGLIDVINFDEPNDPFNREVLANLKESSEQLDQIIYEMNQVVSQNKETNE